MTISGQDSKTFACLVGHNLRRAREASGMSQKAVACRARVHPSALCAYERGRRVPTMEAFVMIALVLGVSPCELLPGLEWDPNGHLD
jgi:transcriptional regulator with XRE-family HTH domain